MSENALSENALSENCFVGKVVLLGVKGLLGLHDDLKII